MIYSKYQQAIFDFCSDGARNLVAGAVAGSGKTTTAVKAAKILIQNSPKSKVHFCAFNQKIALELGEKMPHGTTTSTIHSLGWKAIIQNRGSSAKVDDNKVFKIVKDTIPKKIYKENKKKFQFIFKIVQLVQLLKAFLAFEPEEVKEVADKYGISVTDEEILYCLEVMLINLEIDNVYDFEDMVLFPAVDTHIRVPKYDYLFIDECQDLSQSQQTLLRRCIPSGLFYAFGDKNQAIYGFRGSDAAMYDKLVGIENTATLPLSICYRCGDEIVAEAQKIVPEIEAFEGNEGKVTFEKSVSGIKPGDWIVCRNVKPLIVVALELIASGIKCEVKGKDITAPLQQKLKKIKKDDLDVVRGYLIDDLEDIETDLKSSGVKHPKQHPKYVKEKEIVEIFQAVKTAGIATAVEMLKFLKSLSISKNGNGVYLTTIHSSKGLEAPKVYFLEPGLIPSEFAYEPWQKTQEFNLKYVGITRAMKHLVWLDLGLKKKNQNNE